MISAQTLLILCNSPEDASHSKACKLPFWFISRNPSRRVRITTISGGSLSQPNKSQSCIKHTIIDAEICSGTPIFVILRGHGDEAASSA